jgi:DNA primase
MSDRMLCPFHKEDTPSLTIYANGFHCFGCGKSGPLSMLELGVSKIQPSKPKFREDVGKALAYLKGLPEDQIRGLKLPFDDSGYFIVYPNAPYYIKRSWGSPDTYAKYRSPVGHPKPLMVLNPVRQAPAALFVVEGQMNALSLALVRDNVISPGSCTDFKKDSVYKYCLSYTKVYLIVDRDSGGVSAATSLKERLLADNRRVEIWPMEKPRDFNYILQLEGLSSVQKEVDQIFKSTLGM